MASETSGDLPTFNVTAPPGFFPPESGPVSIFRTPVNDDVGAVSEIVVTGTPSPPSTEEIVGDLKAGDAGMFDEVHDARELIAQAIGAGSMCWENPGGAGEFDSTQAAEVADAAYLRLQKILAGLLSGASGWTVNEFCTCLPDRTISHYCSIHGDPTMPGGDCK